MTLHSYNYTTSKDQKQLFIYVATKDDGFTPEGFTFIFDEELSVEDAAEQDLQFQGSLIAYACYKDSDIVGAGDSPEQALAQGKYQHIRRYTHQVDAFVPTIKRQEALILQENLIEIGECIPTAFTGALDIKDEGGIIDTVYTVEYRDCQWAWADTLVDAVEILAGYTKEVRTHV